VEQRADGRVILASYEDSVVGYRDVPYAGFAALHLCSKRVHELLEVAALLPPLEIVRARRGMALKGR